MMLYQEIYPEIKKKLAYCFDDSVCLSYAVPGEENALRVDRVFLYRNTLDADRTRPFAMLSTAADDGRIISFLDSHYQDFVDTGAYPFQKKLNYRLPEAESVKDFQMEQRMIRKMYEGVRSIAFQPEVSAEQKELLSKYSFLFEHAVPKDLLPFYHGLNPRFYEWLRAQL